MDTTQRDAEPVGLSEAMLAGDPMTQFARWMADAAASGMPEPTAMVLTTVSAEGRPRARTVLLKAHDQSGFTFYSNRRRSGHGLAGSPGSSGPAPSSRTASPSWSGAGRRRLSSRCPTSGADTCWCRRRWNSGRRARSGCTTGSATGVTAAIGPSSAFPLSSWA